MQRRTRYGVFLTTWMLMAQAALGAERVPVLTVEQAVGIALEDSYEARKRRLDLHRAEQEMKAARGAARTTVDMYLYTPDFEERVQDVRLPNQLPTYNTFGTMQWRGTLLVQQPILLTNTTLSLTTDLQHLRESVYDDALEASEKEKRFRSQVRLSLRQPLLVPNDLRLRVERAELQLEQAQRQFTRSRLQIVYDVTQAFYGYYRTVRGLEIAREEMERQEEAYDLAKRKYEAGLIPEVEALQMEVALAESRNATLQAEGQLARSADSFKLALGLEVEDSVTVSSDMTVKTFEVDEAVAVAHGLRYRAEIREAGIGRRLAEIALKQADARTAIRGEVEAYYDRTGVSDPFLAYGSSVGDLFDSSWDDLERRPRNLGIQMSLVVPLWDWGTNGAEVAAARALLGQREVDTELTREQVVQSIRAVITRLREARGRLEVLKKSEAVATRSYEISLARFEAGDITARELSDARESLTRARQTYLDAYIQYQLAVADLKRQTLYDFEDGRSLADDDA